MPPPGAPQGGNSSLVEPIATPREVSSHSPITAEIAGETPRAIRPCLPADGRNSSR